MLKTSRFITIKRWSAEQMAGVVGLVIAVTLIGLGALGLVFLQPRLRESQDLRQQAATDQGQVVLSVQPQPGIFMVDSPGEILLQLNTAGLQTDGVQVFFNLVTPTVDDLNLVLEPNTGLEILYSEIEQTNDGYLVGLIVAPPIASGNGFNSATPVTIARLQLTPLTQNDIQIVFDQSNSLAPVHNSNPVRDELRTIPSVTIPVLHGDPGPTATPTTTPTATPTTTPTATPTTSPTATPTTSPTATPTTTPTTSPTATPTTAPTATPTTAPTATPTTAPVTNDDFYFPSLNDKNAVFWFYELNAAKTGVPSNKLVPGQVYRLELPYLIQNSLKSSSNITGNVQISLFQNNQLIANATVPYASLRATSAGLTGTLTTNFTAQATNTFMLYIDNYNVWPETNEGNNSFERVFTYIGVGGTTYRSCNESCSSNAECGPNFRCHQNVCRLATNTSSTTCTAPTDQGLQRSCNQYCADSRECASGYTCFYNRCRLPSNPDNTSCSAPTVATQQTVIQGCNQACDSNSDCGINLRCYSGACRLATNPGSSSCTAATTATVSETYGNGPKGGNGGDSVNGTPAPIGSAGTPRPTTRPTAGTNTGTGNTGAPVTSDDQSQTSGWSAFWNNLWTDNQPGNPLASIPRLAIWTGLGLLLLLVLLFLALAWRRRRSAPVGPVKPLTTPGASKQYEQNLQARINQLKQSQPARTGLVGSTPVAPTQPQAPGARPGSPLLTRLQDKGVNTPQPPQLPKSS